MDDTSSQYVNSHVTHGQLLFSIALQAVELIPKLDTKEKQAVKKLLYINFDMLNASAR
jgi:hypothetical protein